MINNPEQVQYSEKLHGTVLSSITILITTVVIMEERKLMNMYLKD